jgi:23S rRNA (guanine745-N1)-methyltransferase
VHTERLLLDRPAVTTLVGMGPHAHHLPRAAIEAAVADLTEPVAVTVSVEIGTYGRASRGSPGVPRPVPPSGP